MRTIISKVVWMIKKRYLKKTGEKGYIDIKHCIFNYSDIEIGDNFSAGKNLKIQTWRKYGEHENEYNPSIIIGNNVSIMENCLISCANEITIGDGTVFGDNVFLTDNFHGKNTLEEKSLCERPYTYRKKCLARKECMCYARSYNRKWSNSWCKCGSYKRCTR